MGGAKASETAAWIYSKNLTEKLISKSHEKFRFMVTITIRFPHLHCLAAHYCTYGGHPSFSHILNLPYLANQTTLLRCAPHFRESDIFREKRRGTAFLIRMLPSFCICNRCTDFKILSFHSHFSSVTVSAPFFGERSYHAYQKSATKYVLARPLGPIQWSNVKLKKLSFIRPLRRRGKIKI